jgi:hypothetical protein
LRGDVELRSVEVEVKNSNAFITPGIGGQAEITTRTIMN